MMQKEQLQVSRNMPVSCPRQASCHGLSSWRRPLCCCLHKQRHGLSSLENHSKQTCDAYGCTPYIECNTIIHCHTAYSLQHNAPALHHLTIRRNLQQQSEQHPCLLQDALSAPVQLAAVSVPYDALAQPSVAVPLQDS